MDSDDKYHPDKTHQNKEDKQEEKIEDAIAEEYRNYKPDSEHKIKELKQEGEISESITDEYKEKQSSTKKKYFAITLALVSIIVIFSGSFFFTNIMDSQDYLVNGKPMSSNYLIQNLKGDTVDTWISWKKADGGLFHVHVLDSQHATKERLDAILDVIMSQQEIELDDSLTQKGPKGTSSTYYAGWYGALNSITDDTKFNIVKNLHFHVDDDVATGDIQIILTDLSNPDGYSGYTKSIVDEANHQILKSTITIYNIDEIGLENLKTILRHELGHGFGLAHSTAPEDMMYPVISTNYPYISDCDLDAISFLYDGGESSQVICEK